MNINLNNLSDDALDGLFRQSAKEELVNFEEEAWSKMETKLNSITKPTTWKNRVFNNRTYSIIALLLLISTTFFIIKNKPYQKNIAKTEKNINTRNNNIESTISNIETDKQKIMSKIDNSIKVESNKNNIKPSNIENENIAEKEDLKSVNANQNSGLKNNNTTIYNKSKIFLKKNNKKEENIFENDSKLSKSDNKKLNEANYPNLKVNQNNENSFQNLENKNDKKELKTVFKNEAQYVKNNNSTERKTTIENSISANSSSIKPIENLSSSNVNKTKEKSEIVNEITVVESINNSKKIKLLETNYDQIEILALRVENPVKITNNRVLKKGIGIRIAYSPDLSKISNNAIDNIGNNFGLFLEYRFSNRLMLTSGIIKSKKYYDAYPDQYKWPWNKPASPVVDVNVACKMLDIPVNIRYDFLVKPKNSLFLSTGVTTYIMENEAYLYNFQNGKKRNWAGKTGRYNFSNINISAGAEKQLNKHFSLQAEPFAKIPISKIGFGKVKLLTYGMLVSTKYHF